MQVLVVDDEPTDCRAIVEALTSEGYEVMKAGDAVTGLRLFELSPSIQLLVSDISLPGTNGCELACQILTLRPELKVLFVSGHVGAEVCRYYGITVTDLCFLRKPFTAGELVARVRRVLASAERVQISPTVSGAGSMGA